MRLVRNQRGLSSVLMLASLLPLMVIAGAMLSLQATQLRETESREARARARSISAGGVHDAIARLQADTEFTGTYTVDLDSGTAVVTVVDASIDGVDNDVNGFVDDVGEVELVTVRSEGFLGFILDEAGTVLADHGRNWRGTTEATLRRTHLETDFDAALYVEDPFADVSFSGSAFLVSGIDVGLDGIPTLDSAHPGIGTPGNPSHIKSGIKKSQKKNVIGKGGLPSVQEVEAIDVQGTIEAFASLATMRWEDGETFHGSIGDREGMVPVVAYAKGDLKLGGRTSGCGILLVEGNLEISGSLDFAGIIVVGKSLVFKGGGSRTVFGSMLTGTGLDYIDDFRGSMTVQYSTEAIETMRVAADGVTVLSWRQS